MFPDEWGPTLRSPLFFSLAACIVGSNGRRRQKARPPTQRTTGPADYYPVEQMQLQRFDGKECVRFGEVLGK
jgi:hypothetical protein